MAPSSKRLLVSVRNLTEAKLADQANVDIIDIKEPGNGPLGRANWNTIENILSGVRTQQVVSAALGEAVDCIHWLDDTRPVPPFLQRLDYAKCGLAGTSSGSWRDLASTMWKRISRFARPVAVAYADHQNSNSPVPLELLHHAVDQNIETFLVDTHEKKDQTVFDFLSRTELSQLISITRLHQIRFVLAGSINFEVLTNALGYDVDYIGVRGVVCEGGRASELSSARLTKLQEFMRQVNCSSPDYSPAGSVNS